MSHWTNLRALASAALLMVIVGTSRLAPAAERQPETLSNVIAAAKKEGRLNIAWPLPGGAAEMSAWTSAFKDLYGYDVKVQNTPNNVMTVEATRLLQEYRAGQPNSVDVFIGSETLLIPLVQAGALLQTDWSFAPGIERFVYAQGRAVAFASRLPGVTYNTEAVKPADVPKTLAEFVASKHAIATTSYGTSLSILASPEAWGEAKTLEFVKRLSAKAVGFMNCGQVGRLLTGEFDMFGLDCGTFEARQNAARGGHVRAVVMQDAAIVSYIHFAIPKRARHPQTARLWINFMLTRPAQDILYKYEFTDLHRLPGSRSAPEIRQLQAQGVKFIEADYDYAWRNAKDTERLRTKFQAVLQER